MAIVLAMCVLNITVTRKFNKIILRLKKQKRPVRYLFAYFLLFTRLCRFLIINRELYRLRFFPTGFSAKLWANPEEGSADERFFKTYLRHGDTVIDVGANIGTSTLTASILAGPSGVVYSFEPHPRVFEHLKENVRLNELGNIHLFNVAVGGMNGFVSFADNPLISDTTNRVVADSKTQVKISTLDDLLRPYDLGTVDLLKVDVEGYEKEVFQGGMETLKKTNCVFFEFLEKNYSNYDVSAREVLEALRENGFKIYKVKGLDGNLLGIRDIESIKKRLDSQSLFPFASENMSTVHVAGQS